MKINTKNDLQKSLGSIVYLSSYMPSYLNNASAIFNMLSNKNLKNGNNVVWTPQLRILYNNLCVEIKKIQCLVVPSANSKVIISTDASLLMVSGACQSITEGGKRLFCGFACRKKPQMVRFTFTTMYIELYGLVAMLHCFRQHIFSIL